MTISPGNGTQLPWAKMLSELKTHKKTLYGLPPEVLQIYGEQRMGNKTC